MVRHEQPEGCGKQGDNPLQKSRFVGFFARVIRMWPSFILLLLLGWPSVWFLTNFPVLWNYMDGFLQVSTKPGAANLIVWPPLYCFGARIPMLVGYFIGGGTFNQLVRYFIHPVLTDSAVLTLIITQHLALLGAAFLFIRTLSKNSFVRIFLALIFSCFSFLYATAHTVGSESGSIVFILLIAAFSVEIARSGQLGFRRSILLSGRLCAAVLTRHINAVVLVLPVVAAAFPRFDHGRGFVEAFRSAVLRVFVGVGAGLAALALANCLVWLWCLRAKVDHRSMVGLTFLARIDQFRNVPGRFSDFVDEMTSRLSDPLLVEALQQLKRANEAQSVGVDFITEAKSTLLKVLSDHGLSSNDPKFRSLADEKFNALMTATLLAQPKSFRQAVASDWGEGQNWPCGFFTHCAISGTAIDWNNDPLSTKMQPLRSLATFSQFSFADLNALAKNFKDPFVADNIAIWHLIVAVCILSVLAGILRIPAWNIAIAVTMLAVGELIYLLTCAVAGQVCRYGIPFLELALCAVLTLIAGILDCFVLRWNQSRHLQNRIVSVAHQGS